MLGQPQPQPFKYFALNIFREISLILSPRSFSSFMLQLIYLLRENNMHPFFIWCCLYTATKVVVPTVHSLFFLLHLVGYDLLDRLEYVTTLYLVIAIWRQATINRTIEWPHPFFFLTLLAELQTQCWRERLFVTTWSCVSVCVIVKWGSLANGEDSYSPPK